MKVRKRAMDNVKVLGIIKRTYTEGKNAGRTGVTYHLCGEFSDYDKENSDAKGYQVFSEFAYKDFGVEVGDIVMVVYGKGFQGKANLENIVPTKLAKKDQAS
jgi:hypothetical protein